MRLAARSSGSLPSACTQSTSHSAALPTSRSTASMPRRSDTTPVSLFAAIVHTSAARGASARSTSSRWRPSPSTGSMRSSRSVPSSRFQCARLSGIALCSVAPIRTMSPQASPRARRSRTAHRAESTAVWMPSVAPLLNINRPSPAPTTRPALARTLSRSARARRPVAWLLLGLPKPSCMAAMAAAAAAGNTGDVALVSR